MVDNVLSAGNVIKSILPDANDRWIVLDRFIRSARLASSIAPAALSATLWQNGFRLNVGQVETFTYVDENFRIMLAANSSDPRLAGCRFLAPRMHLFAGHIVLLQAVLLNIVLLRIE